MLYPGLYEQVINNALNRELAEIPEAASLLRPSTRRRLPRSLAAVSDRRGAEGS